MLQLIPPIMKPHEQSSFFDGFSKQEIFLEIHLSNFTNRSEVEVQEEEHQFSKRILAQKSWPIDAVVGADCRVVGAILLGGVVVQSRDEFRFNFASKEGTIAIDRGHNQAAIGPRSRGDQASIVEFSPAIFC